MAINPDELKFLHCSICADSLPDGEAMRDYARLSVAVTPQGNLLVECVRHDEVVAYITNGDIAHVLREAAGRPCGCANHKKETLH